MNRVEITKTIADSQNFDNLIVNSRGIESADIYTELSDYKKSKDQSGIGVFLSALYKGCRSMGDN